MSISTSGGGGSSSRRRRAKDSRFTKETKPCGGRISGENPNCPNGGWTSKEARNMGESRTAGEVVRAEDGGGTGRGQEERRTEEGATMDQLEEETKEGDGGDEGKGGDPRGGELIEIRY
ncbi:hypothetical protein NL676_005193 [Syzygium grande]|nr:hypothetical protein NL676_005193 [Syzygium grande]